MISVIVRTYNNEKFIRRAIKSILNQTFNNYEIIIINDGSTDKTKEIIDSFDDQKLKVIHQENQGMFESGFLGLKLAKELVVFLDGDDEVRETFLEDLYNVLENNAFSYCDYDEVNVESGEKKIVSCKNVSNCLAAGILFRKNVLNEIGFWDKSLIFPEHDLIIRLLKKYKGVHVPKSLYIYNRHKGSYTDNQERVKKGREQLFEKYGQIEGLKDY